MEGRLFLYVVVGKGATVFQLLASEDQSEEEIIRFEGKMLSKIWRQESKHNYHKIGDVNFYLTWKTHFLDIKKYCIRNQEKIF